MEEAPEQPLEPQPVERQPSVVIERQPSMRLVRLPSVGLVADPEPVGELALPPPDDEYLPVQPPVVQPPVAIQRQDSLLRAGDMAMGADMDPDDGDGDELPDSPRAAVLQQGPPLMPVPPPPPPPQAEPQPSIVTEMVRLGFTPERVVNALRQTGGERDRAIDLLLARPAPGAAGRPSPDAIANLEAMGFTRGQAIAALRHTPNIEFAASWILDNPDQAAEEEEEEEPEEAEEGPPPGEAAPRQVELTEAEMIERAAAYAAEENAEEAAARGHDLATQSGSCALCHSPVDGLICGGVACSMCNICAGCLAEGVVRSCPALLNGGDLHAHPLVLGRRDDLRCNIGRENCWRGTSMWHCQTCRWAVCPPCMKAGVAADAPPPPRAGRAAAGFGKGKGKGKGLPPPPPVVPQFNATTADRIAAQSWDLRRIGMEGAVAPVEGNAGTIMLGAGVVGGEEGREGASEISVPASQAPLLDRSLSGQSQAALEGFRGKGGPNLRAARAAAAGAGHPLPEDEEAPPTEHAVATVTTAEDLLLRAAGAGLKAAEQDQVRAAVAAGELGVAGQIIMSCSLRSAVEQGSQVLCGVCAEEIAPSAQGGVVGCLTGHPIHASCAADLVLGGGVCPTCRAPLYFAQVDSSEAAKARDMAAEEVDEEEEDVEVNPDRQYRVGDIVRVSNNQQSIEALQVRPGAGGYHPEMLAARGQEGEVIDLRQVTIKTNDGDVVNLSLIEVVTFNRQDVYWWHPHLLTFVSNGNSPLDKERLLAKHSAEQLSRLRAELAAIKRARAEVGLRIASELGVVAPVQGAEEEAEAEAAAPVVPPPLQRLLTGRSLLAVDKLGTDISPADMQRARHLLALARQWGDSARAKEARAMLHEAVQVGDIDSVARTVRRHNAVRYMQHAEWSDAAKPQGEYRMAPGVRVELLTRPRRGAPRSGFALPPGMEFKSIREAVDADGGHWIRLGDARSTAIAVWEDAKAKARRKIREEDAEEEEEREVPIDLQVTVRMEDFPHAIGARVRRGPDWQYADDDGGDRGLGTILGLYTERGWARVRWDIGRRPEDYHRIGAERCYDLFYEGLPPLTPPAPQGWLQMRPGGPGTLAVAGRVRGALRCFACGGELQPPFHMGARGGGASAAFAPVTTDAVKAGDIVIIAATFEQVVVVEVMQNPLAQANAAAAGNNQALVLCRFQDDGTGEEPEEAVFRAMDLVWPASRDGGHAEEFRIVDGQPRSRRELVLMKGSVEAAREAWDAVDVEDDPQIFASCVRGHIMHARCFQGRLVAGSSCPCCPELLFVPRVQRTRRGGDDCCGGDGEGAAAAAALGEAQAVEVAAAQQASAEADDAAAADVVGRTVQGARGNQLQMKMCPVCCSGPLLNENCSDLRAHHGQCPRCSRFPFSAAAIAEALVHGGTTSVGERIPKCDRCNVTVLFNGCAECGHLFVDTDWDELPTWDDKAKACLEVQNRHRRAARMLAEQVQKEAALLAYERAALEEACSGVAEIGGEEMAEPPPPPTPLPPRCGPQCRRYHKGNCLVCEAPARLHDGHECPDGRRGSWLLLPEYESDYPEYEEEE